MGLRSFALITLIGGGSSVSTRLEGREHGVLIGVTGRHGNVIKVRPPLPFSRGNVDILAEKLDQTCPGPG